MDGFDRSSQAVALDVIDDSILSFVLSSANEHVVDRRNSYHSGLLLQFAGTRPKSPENSGARHGRLAVKRLFDVVLSALALIALAPLFGLVALAIVVESRGPVFFRQNREGLNGALFPAFKFRSMRTEQCDASGVAFTVASDKRITRVGAFLRRTSIDELPQLLNVLFGHMSLVGPRPHVPGMLAAGHVYREFVPYYDDRLAMLPGITGWAQANGYRGDASDPGLAKARVDHDVAYVQNFSLWLDLRIVLITVGREFIGGSGR